MFGYIQVNCKMLSEEEKKRFRACYCGLCHVLHEKYGDAGRLTLSNDMTFLSLLLSSLYEPDETCYDERCVLHPVKKHQAVVSRAAEYAADMNILLAYFKCLDDVGDEKSLKGRTGERLLCSAYKKVRERYPEKCEKVKECLDAIAALEKENSEEIDALVRLSGQMLAETFLWKQDAFEPYLRGVASALGGFIYLMDAYEDYDEDIKRGRYNPLKALHAQSDYQERMQDILILQMGKCVRALDCLPLEQDSALLRNILYSGVWGKYALIQSKRKETD
ncbi:MAG: hypothetical protein IKW00_02760 [Clostridia bacterium]|nr:hypothetical protein [Clostridia bacterium]